MKSLTKLAMAVSAAALLAGSAQAAEIKVGSAGGVTGPIAELVAVTKLDGEAVGDGKPGPIIRRLRDAYYEDVERFIKSGD